MAGYRVGYERKDGKGLLISEFFPEAKDGYLFGTKLEAWDAARAFAKANVGKCVNVYVMDEHFIPVSDAIIKNR